MKDYGFFIWGAYGASAAVLIALTLYVVFDARRQKRILAALEARNVPRRRASSTAGKAVKKKSA
jgi:heme exporter protein CcmD